MQPESVVDTPLVQAALCSVVPMAKNIDGTDVEFQITLVACIADIKLPICSATIEQLSALYVLKIVNACILASPNKPIAATNIAIMTSTGLKPFIGNGIVFSNASRTV